MSSDTLPDSDILLDSDRLSLVGDISPLKDVSEQDMNSNIDKNIRLKNNGLIFFIIKIDLCYYLFKLFFGISFITRKIPHSMGDNMVFSI